MKNKSSSGYFEIEIPKSAENVQLPDPALLNYYKGKERRLFWLLGAVDDSLYDLIQEIIECNCEDKGIPVEQRQPIKLVIASLGGSLEVERAITSIIEASTTPVYCIAIGVCASAASMIYLSGHKHFATQNAYFVFHQGGCENLDGTYQQIVAFMEKYRKDIEEMAEFYKSHTKFSPEMIDEKLSEGDWYISADEALENGIADEIIKTLDVFV